eukprot:12105783-Alexandrium_andersonii.AAC.1
MPIPMCALACVLFSMTTADTVPSVTNARTAKSLLPKSNALAGGRALQNNQGTYAPPVDPDAFQGGHAMHMLSWTQLWDDGIFYRCAIRARYAEDYLKGGSAKGYTTQFDCERPSWTHLVIQAATLNGLSGSVKWNDKPEARLPDQWQIRDQLPPKWEVNPFRALNSKVCRPLALHVPAGAVRSVTAE